MTPEQLAEELMVADGPGRADLAWRLFAGLVRDGHACDPSVVRLEVSTTVESAVRRLAEYPTLRGLRAVHPQPLSEGAGVMTRLKGRSAVGVSLTLLFSIVTILVIVFPLYWTLVTSVKQASDVFRSPPVFLPDAPTLANYVTVWRASAIPRYLLNTVLIAGSTVAIVLCSRAWPRTASAGSPFAGSSPSSSVFSSRR
jgi:hypothetical protein